MRNRRFTLVVPVVLDDPQVDAIYGVCHDVTATSRGGATSLRFDRDGDSLEGAIRSALGDVAGALESVGFPSGVARVEFAPSEMAGAIPG